MAKSGGSDQFANLAVITVAEAVAGTLAFKKLETGISLFEKLAWILHRVEYEYDVNATQFNTSGDAMECGLSTSDQISSIASTNAAVIDRFRCMRADYGTAASSYLFTSPFVKDFTNLPGGGIIVPPNPLYAFVKGTGLAAVAGYTIRIFYTNKPLEPDQFWELVEARRIISAS
jgi:hypothetical protein